MGATGHRSTVHHDARQHAHNGQTHSEMSENFLNFQSLPAEIRAMIWEYSMPEARVYEVLDAPNAKQRTPAQQGLMFANRHPEPPPALAAVCRESRYFVLRHYQPLTLGKTTKYVDLARDMLLLEPYLLVKRLHRTLHFMSQIPQIRDHTSRLALGTSYGVYMGISHPVLSWKLSKTNIGKMLVALAKFPKLKTLIFIVHQEFQFEFDFRYPPTFPTFSTMTMLGNHAPAAALGLGPRPGATSATPVAFPPAAIAPAIPPSTSATSSQALTPIYPTPSPTPSLSGQPSLSPDPTPPSPTAPRPQIVHQAYRFKFDIEANINHHPRRPHVNEMLYYPLDNTDEDREAETGEWGNGWDEAAVAQLAADEEAEWCDPWPTNDDWRRFRRRFQRAVLVSLDMGLADGAYTRQTLPAVKGASLLWRYSRGGGVMK